MPQGARESALQRVLVDHLHWIRVVRFMRDGSVPFLPWFGLQEPVVPDMTFPGRLRHGSVCGVCLWGLGNPTTG